MRVALIDPSFYHQGKLLKLKRVGYFPLTLPRLASMFPADTSIALIYEKCQNVETDAAFDLVMFTTMGSNLIRAEELSDRFRERGVPTVVGGFSVSPLYGAVPKKFRFGGRRRRRGGNTHASGRPPTGRNETRLREPGAGAEQS